MLRPSPIAPTPVLDRAPVTATFPQLGTSAGRATTPPFLPSGLATACFSDDAELGDPPYGVLQELAAQDDGHEVVSLRPSVKPSLTDVAAQVMRGIAPLLTQESLAASSRHRGDRKRSEDASDP